MLKGLDFQQVKVSESNMFQKCLGSSLALLKNGFGAQVHILRILAVCFINSYEDLILIAINTIANFIISVLIIIKWVFSIIRYY